MVRRLVHLCLWTAVLLGCVFAVRHWRMADAEESWRQTVGRALASAATVDAQFELVRPAAGPPSRIGGQRDGSECLAAAEGPCAPTEEREAAVNSAETSERSPSLRHILGLNDGRRFVLIVLFSPIDCPACLEEAAVWNRLAAVGDDSGEPLTRVIGIADRTTTEEMQYVVRDLGLTFPVYVDRDSTVRHELGVQVTPFKVLLTADGAVEVVDGSRQVLDEQRRFERRVLDIVRRVN